MAPYIPSFLAFREADAVVEMIKDQVKQRPEVKPDYIMVDGNGMLHCRKFGLACHIGVRVDIPTFGVAKNLYSLNSDESQSPKEVREENRRRVREELLEAGDSFEVLHDDGSRVGLTLRTTKAGSRPVYVSVGHRISLDMAKTLTMLTSFHKFPEPTRQADLIGREYIRQHFP